MKKTIVLLIMAAGLAMQGAAAANNSGPSAMTKADKANIRYLTKILKPEKVDRTKVNRVGGISSRPWDQAAGMPVRTLFADERYGQPHFTLFWVGERPY